MQEREVAHGIPGNVPVCDIARFVERSASLADVAVEMFKSSGPVCIGMMRGRYTGDAPLSWATS